jgi:hypothetical protein
MPTNPKCWTFKASKVNATVYRIKVVGIAVLFVATLTGCRKATTGTQNPPATQAKQLIQQLPPQWQQEEIKRRLQAEQQKQFLQELLMRQAQTLEQQRILERQRIQEQQIRAMQEQLMRAAQELQRLEWSRNYFISQIYPRIEASFAYISNALNLIEDCLLGNHAVIFTLHNLSPMKINFGVPTNFYPPEARDLLLSAEQDLRQAVGDIRINAHLICFGPPELARAVLSRNKDYIFSALEKIAAAEGLLLLPLMLPQPQF